jgi:hypothetical protein
MSYGEIYIAEQTMNRRAEEQVQDAESRRLKRNLLGGRQRWTGIYAGTMAWLGQRLIAYGEKLQARYDSSRSPMAQSANHLAS